MTVLCHGVLLHTCSACKLVGVFVDDGHRAQHACMWISMRRYKVDMLWVTRTRTCKKEQKNSSGKRAPIDKKEMTIPRGDTV